MASMDGCFVLENVGTVLISICRRRAVEMRMHSAICYDDPCVSC